MSTPLSPAEFRPRNQHRLAITVADPNTQLYPAKTSCPNTYWIVFVDAKFAAAQGRVIPTVSARQNLPEPRTLAHNLIEGVEGYVPQYTLIEVAWHNRQWWFSHVDATPCSSSGSSGSGASGSGSGPSGSESGGSGSGSDKSTAIVPASWTVTGYTALFIAESPEVRFDDVMVAKVAKANTYLPIDPRFLEVCAANSVQVCGCVPDVPVLVGAVVEGDKVRVQFAKEDPNQIVQVVIRLTGVRRGFLGHRFPDRTRAQFEANERFIRSAYPSE